MPQRDTKDFLCYWSFVQREQFSDFDLEGFMRWVLSETRAFKGVLSS
jgi:hypothetical protein